MNMRMQEKKFHDTVAYRVESLSCELDQLSLFTPEARDIILIIVQQMYKAGYALGLSASCEIAKEVLDEMQSTLIRAVEVIGEGGESDPIIMGAWSGCEEFGMYLAKRLVELGISLDEGQLDG